MGRTTDSLLELAGRVSPHPDPRELDMLLSTRERIASALVAMAVHDLGHEAVSFTGSQAGILTDAVYTRAKIREITPVRVLDALERGKIVLVAGFQGFSRDTMDVTTLGRGGTDATAVALAAALGASCEIYSDVPGVFTADPRIVSDARKLPAVSYEEMLEMAASGAKVLMLRAVELARGTACVSTPARRSPTSPARGWRSGNRASSRGPCARSRTPTTTSSSPCAVSRGWRPRLSCRLPRSSTSSVDSVVLRAGREAAELAFSVAADDVPATRRALAHAEDRTGPLEVEEAADLGKVSVVGAGMRSRTGVAAHMFRALGDERIEPRLISTSPIKISCLVDRVDVPRGVRALHDAFALGLTAEGEPTG